MNDVTDVNLRNLSVTSAPSASSHSVLSYRDPEYLMFYNPRAITIWYASLRTRGECFSIPTDEGFCSGLQLHQNSRDLKGLVSFGNICFITPWTTVVMKKDSISYESVAVFPPGPTSSSDIKMYHVLHRERLILAFITVGNQLIVVMDSKEDTAFSDRVFHVVVSIFLESIVSPSSVTIYAPSEGGGESVFVSDSYSDRVCEYRFESSLCDTPRGIPDMIVAYWYLQSGVPIGFQSKVTFMKEDSEVSVQIIGTYTNRDSQGIVRLVNFRDMSFSTPRWSKGDTAISESIQRVEGLLSVNSKNHFRICEEDNYDFPLFVKCPVSKVHALHFNSRIILVALNDGIIRFFEFIRESKTIQTLDWGPIYDVENFSCSSDPGRIFIAYMTLCGSFKVIVVNELSGILSETIAFDLSEKVITIGIRSPLNGADPIQFALVTENENLILTDGKINDNISGVIDTLFCEEYLFVLSREQLQIRPLYSKSGVQTLEISSDSQTKMKSFRDQDGLKLLLGSSVITRTVDFYEGVQWRIIETNSLREGIYDLFGDKLFALRDGKIEKSTLCADSTPQVHYVLPLLRRCLDEPASVSIEALPDSLKSKISPFMASYSAEYERSCDRFARRFLTEFFFAREFPQVISVSSEALAFAALSETPDFILNQIGSFTSWDSVRETGLVYWFSESTRLKGIAEGIQKAALQEYMRNNDPIILDTRLSFWLALLGKQQLLASLYKQHGTSCASPMHTRVAQFLTTDFSISENRSKGVKNAFELVRQKRFEMAVAVFLLSGAFREAVDICCRQMNDVQLGLMVLKVLKSRIGIDQDSVKSLVDDLWESRIVLPMSERGDVFFSFLHAFNKQDTSLVRFEVKARFSQLERSNAIGPFKLIKSELCKFAIHKFLTVFSERMGRLNRPVRVTFESAPTLQERAIELLETGCSDSAKTLDNFETLEVCLQWAINQQASFSD